jgi:hypothetical protein
MSEENISVLDQIDWNKVKSVKIIDPRNSNNNKNKFWSFQVGDTRKIQLRKFFKLKTNLIEKGSEIKKSEVSSPVQKLKALFKTDESSKPKEFLSLEGDTLVLDFKTSEKNFDQMFDGVYSEIYIGFEGLVGGVAQNEKLLYTKLNKYFGSKGESTEEQNPAKKLGGFR